MTDCRSYAQRIGAAATPAEFVVLPGARHKFDLDSSRLEVKCENEGPFMKNGRLDPLFAVCLP